MEDRRRSQEEEAELDKKIALIREKNTKIVQRSKEIEKDLIDAGEQTKKRNNGSEGVVQKTPKPIEDSKRENASPKNAKGSQWKREWDHGKTPAESWRENVPSMESVDHKGGGGGRRGMGVKRGAGGGGGFRGGRTFGNQQRTRGGRLEGRVTRVSHGEEEEEGGEQQNEEGQPAARRNRRVSGKREDRRVLGDKDGDRLVIQIKNVANGGGEGRRRGGSQSGSKVDIKKQSRARRPRRENDKYVVRQVLRTLVDRVVAGEQRERRRLQKEAKAAEAEAAAGEGEGAESIEKDNDKNKQKEASPESDAIDDAPQTAPPSKEATPALSEEADGKENEKKEEEEKEEKKVDETKEDAAKETNNNNDESTQKSTEDPPKATPPSEDTSTIVKLQTEKVAVIEQKTEVST